MKCINCEYLIKNVVFDTFEAPAAMVERKAKAGNGAEVGR